MNPDQSSMFTHRLLIAALGASYTCSSPAPPGVLVICASSAIFQQSVNHRAAVPSRQRAALCADRSFMCTPSQLIVGLGASYTCSPSAPPGLPTLSASRRSRRFAVARPLLCHAVHHLLGCPSIGLAACVATLPEQRPEESRAVGSPAIRWLLPCCQMLLGLHGARGTALVAIRSSA